MNANEHSLTVPAEAAGSRADVWLVRALPSLSRARIQALIAAGLVLLDGRVLKASVKLLPGQTLCLTVPPLASAIPQPEALPLDIVYEDADVLVLDKKAGLVVHPAPGHASGTLVNALLYHCAGLAAVGEADRPGIVHRLDKDTTGLMVVAKSATALASLVAQFKQDTVDKGYLALVHGVPQPSSATLDTLIGRHPRDRKRMAVVVRNGKRAVTHFTVVRRFGAQSLLEVKIETGRTHQIRVHLAHLGHPLVGDPLYGMRVRARTLSDAPSRQMLHAARLGFTQPGTGKPLVFVREPPADMRALIERLALANS